MRNIAGPALALLLCGCLEPQPGRGMTALVGATLVDGTGANAVENGVVLMRGERIVAAGGAGETSIPAGAERVDLRGKWITPGLIDAHVHFFQSGGLYTRPDVLDLRSLRTYEEELAFIRSRLDKTLARYLASGVTAVADVGGPFWNFKVRNLARRTLLSPRVAAAGPLISTISPSQLATDDPAIIRVDSPEEARALVRREAEAAPDLVKIWFIPSRRNFEAQLEFVEAAIDESHKAGLRVAVHATQLEVARAAVLAGADVLVHSVDDRPVDDDFVRLMLEHDVVYTTTLSVLEGYKKVLLQKVTLTDIDRRLGDPDVISSFADMSEVPEKLLPRPAVRRRLERLDNSTMLANLKRLQAADVRIAAGTDAGNIGTLHGPAIHRELELMAEAGLTPAEVLRAATAGGAAVMGRTDDFGTVEPGKIADLLVLDADPLADVRHLRRIHLVVKGGVQLQPERLEAALRD